MREVKFRAWNIESKVMLDHDFITETIIQDGEIVRDFSDVLNGKDTFILMQYTGLKDKNGVDIYDGDNVLHNGKLSRVKWSEKYCQFRIEGSRATTGLNFFHSRHYEVIGNIYDNPDLLEVAK